MAVLCINKLCSLSGQTVAGYGRYCSACGGALSAPMPKPLHVGISVALLIGSLLAMAASLLALKG
jgi:hypothetical protein